MDTVVKTLFADGTNDGDVTVLCKDGDFTCHSFVIRYTCPTLKTMYEHNMSEKETSDQGVIMATDYSTNVMKYLISMLYDCTLGETPTFRKLLVKPYPVTGKETKCIQYCLDSDLLIEYIKAKDYFGIEYGCEEYPINPNMYFALNILKNLPALSIYDSLKKCLYNCLTTNLEDLDLCDERISFLFESPELCKEVMGLYSKKLKNKQ